MAQPRLIHQRPARDRRVPDQQVEPRARLRKELWTFTGNRIAVRFQYECRDVADLWWRSYGNELWEFTEDGRMSRREASINDVSINESERRIFGPRPAGEQGHPIPVW